MGPKRSRRAAQDVPPPLPPDVEDDDENGRTFMDLFDGEDFAGDGNLTDTEIDYGNSDSDEDDEVDDDRASENSDDEVRTAVPRKQKFKNLDEVMDESKYEALPAQPIESHKWKPSRRDEESKEYSWTTDFNSQGRAPRRNVLSNRPGPSPQAKQCSTTDELFDCYVTEGMFDGVAELTNKKIDVVVADHPQWQDSNKYPHVKHTDAVEIRALFGQFYIRAVTRQNLLSVKRLYQHRHANPIFKAIFSRDRLVFLTGILQFDDIDGREERWETDRFAAFREFFRLFNEHCAQMRIPSDLLALDETLYPFRGRIGIKQYNPKKPAKYGLLYRSISDAERPYTYYTLPYAGKPNVVTQESEYVTGTDNYTKYLVKGLERCVDLRGRNLSIDRFFTSVTIAEWLRNRGLTVVGTLRSDRKGIPHEVKKTDGRDDKSTKYFYCEDINSLLISYVIKKKSGWKNVLVLSSMHKSVKVTNDERRKPDVIVFYDHTKGGVDIMDQMAGHYSTRCKTRRWTINSLCYVLDTIRTNIQTLWNEMYPEKKMSSHDLLWDLADHLIKPHVQRRYDNRAGIQKPIVLAMMDVLGIKEYVPQNFNPGPPAAKRRCYYCLLDTHGKANAKELKNKLGKFKFACAGNECDKALCHDHMIVYCDSCVEKITQQE